MKWSPWAISYPPDTTHSLFFGVLNTLFWRIFVPCLFPFLECELQEGRTLSVSWDVMRASGSYSSFPREHPWPSSAHALSENEERPCAPVSNPVQTQPNPTGPFHLAGWKGWFVMGTTPKLCDRILGLLFELFPCLKPERTWGPQVLLPSYFHPEFVRTDGRLSPERERTGSSGGIMWARSPIRSNAAHCGVFTYVDW